ncbi:MAG: hypothetical protein SOZ78_01090 [Eubacteriales bacterium]|nr:hypothetical protein [Eubacteriales bacterium]
MKKQISILLSLLMIIGLAAVAPLAVFAKDDEAEPLPIADAASFAAMDQTGSYYLTADITIDATYIGTFAGILDGKGHKLTISVPVFENVKGTVKDLVIEGKVENTSAEILAALACNAVAGAKFEKIINRADVIGDASKTKRAAGVVALINAGDDTAVITDCMNTGKIVGYVAGGVIGRADAKTEVRGCLNTGVIEGGDTLGGVFAWPVKEFIIENCTNGVKDGAATVADTGDSSGGIVSYVSGGNSGTIRNCTNYSDIKNTSGKCAAGIVARLGGSSSVDFFNCTNYGKIENANGSWAAGGIAGESEGIVNFDGCLNFGAVDSTKYKAGGICGGLSQITTVKNCVNFADIHALKQAGGIIGACGNNKIESGDYIFELCGNDGNITTDKDTAAGIVAYVYGNDKHAPKLKGCYNTGNVTGGCEASGLIGYFNGTSAAEIKNCFVTGKIKTTDTSMKSCVFFWCKLARAMDEGNISGNFYIAGCADTEKYEAGAYVDAAANLTADDVKSGKLAYDMNTLLGGEFFFQTIGTNAAPTTDKSQKSVKLVNGKYTNESGTTPVTPTAPATGDGTPVYIIAAVLAIMTMITVIVTGKKKSKAE